MGLSLNVCDDLFYFVKCAVGYMGVIGAVMEPVFGVTTDSVAFRVGAFVGGDEFGGVESVFESWGASYNGVAVPSPFVKGVLFVFVGVLGLVVGEGEMGAFWVAIDGGVEVDEGGDTLHVFPACSGGCLLTLCIEFWVDAVRQAC